MKKILIFAGTTEGRELSEILSSSRIAHTVCVATEYGEIVMKENPLVKIHCGRMDREEMEKFFQKEEAEVVVDATHPYAEAVTQNIKAAAEEGKLQYLRLCRDLKVENAQGQISYFSDNKECAKELENTEGNILLTTGSKELSVYCASENVKNRLYVRVLPGLESLRICKEQGIVGKQILALQGPFSVLMNEAILRQYQIKCLVTKESGKAGGFPEKLEAAKRVGIPVFVIGHPKEENGYSFKEICNRLENICNCKIKKNVGKLEILLVGTGMGSRDSLTVEVCHAIETADILLGAQRLIENYEPALEKQPYYTGEKIVNYLEKVHTSLLSDGGKVVILFSGDSGFYSGCKPVYMALQTWMENNDIDGEICILPGISSVSCLAAAMGESYQDAAIYSIHGRKLSNLAGKIRSEKKTFLLLSGVKDLNCLGHLLLESGLDRCEITAGFQLSYPEQKIWNLTPAQCCDWKEEGLYVCCIKNPDAENRKLTHGLADGEFIREKVPMTKEEVREVCICKLKLTKDAVVYDIGSGTGSIAVEIASLSDDIQVYAIEKKKEAVSLIEQNRRKFGLENIKIIPESAPEGMISLPAPTHAFIGGSGGNLMEILADLYAKNPAVRVVLTAVSLETICEIKEVMRKFSLMNEELVQMQVSRAKEAGSYHLMQAENPVWIFAFHFQSDADWEKALGNSGSNAGQNS